VLVEVVELLTKVVNKKVEMVALVVEEHKADREVQVTYQAHLQVKAIMVVVVQTHLVLTMVLEEVVVVLLTMVLLVLIVVEVLVAMVQLLL
tara:strand:- start:247 stop:519 length:273 start_codon:yes stop_codon:yes gene_type:complete